MSEHHTGPAELGAPMNYPEHEKTYAGFISVAKYGTALLVALMIAMAAGFFTAGGWFGGLVLFIVLAVASFVLL